MQYRNLLLKLKNKLINLSVIDFIFVLIVVFVSVFLYSKYRRTEARVYVDLSFEREFKGRTSLVPPEYWEVYGIHEGSIAYNSLNLPIAEIVRVENRVWGGGSREYIRVVAQLRAIKNVKTGTYVFDGKPLRIGQNLSLSVDNIDFSGIVVNIFDDLNDRFSDYKKTSAEITVSCREYEPWHAERIKDLEVADSHGMVLVKVKDIKVFPSQMVVPDARANLYIRENPQKSDFIATIDLPNVLCTERACYFDNYKTFEVGSEFWADNGDTWFGENCSIMNRKIN